MTTWTALVNAGTDDADENASSGSANRTNTSLRGHSAIVASPGNQWNFGARFVSSPIDRGAYIASCQPTVVCNSSANDDPDGFFYLQDAGDCVTFPAGVGADDVNSRPRTTDSVGWTATGVGTSRTGPAGTGLRAAMQHVVNRSDYANGSDVCLLWIATANLGTNFAVRSRDSAGGSGDAPQMSVDYFQPNWQPRFGVRALQALKRSHER